MHRFLVRFSGTAAAAWLAASPNELWAQAEVTAARHADERAGAAAIIHRTEIIHSAALPWDRPAPRAGREANRPAARRPSSRWRLARTHPNASCLPWTRKSSTPAPTPTTGEP